MKYDCVVPLGADCLPALRLKDLHYRQESFPFDWLWRGEMDNHQIEEVCNCLCNNFGTFFNPSDFIVFDEQKKVKNLRTGFVWEHEHSEGTDKEFIDSIIEKHSKRAQRLINKIEESDSVLFVYVEKNHVPPCTDELLQMATSKVINRFSRTQIDFLFIFNDENLGNQDIKVKQLNDRVKVCFINNSEKFSPSDGWHRNKCGMYNVLLNNIQLNLPTTSNATKEPEVSVILPTFNCPDFFVTCVNSILNQDFTNFELLIIDDSTNDNIRNKLGLFDDERIRYLRGPGEGLAAALNFGIKNAKGSYIARADADDFYDRTRFSKQVDYLNKNPSVGLVGTYQQHFGTSDTCHTPPIDPEVLEVFLLFRCDVCHSTIMFRKGLLLEYPEDSLQEDFELWNKSLGKIKFATIPEILSYYRVHSSSLTAAKEKELEKYELNIIRDGLERCFKINLLKDDDVILNQRNFSYGRLSPFGKKDIREKTLALHRRIEQCNNKTNFFNPNTLHKGLVAYQNALFRNDSNSGRVLETAVRLLGIRIIRYRQIIFNGGYSKKLFISSESHCLSLKRCLKRQGFIYYSLKFLIFPKRSCNTRGGLMDIETTTQYRCYFCLSCQVSKQLSPKRSNCFDT